MIGYADATLADPYHRPVEAQVPVDQEARQAWTEVAASARMSKHMLRSTGDPRPGSNFAQINDLYRFEKASDWHRSFLDAAVEHLVMWADFAAPLKFHADHAVTFTFRPAHTLARAALESASLAVWMSSGGTAEECARRHLSLIRWDFEEHRKSRSDASFKQRVKDADAELLRRVEGTFAEADVRPPSQLAVLRAAAPVTGIDPDEVESVWRAASGAAHGKTWTTLAMQHVALLDEYEPGHFRTLRLPDTAQMANSLRIADAMTTYGVLRHADFSGADIPQLLEEARFWLASVTPFRDASDPAVIARLKKPPPTRLAT